MDGESWLYLLLASLFAWTAKIQHWISQIPERYVPRSQIDARLSSERDERREDMKIIRGQLQYLIDKIDSKADK